MQSSSLKPDLLRVPSTHHFPANIGFVCESCGSLHKAFEKEYVLRGKSPAITTHDVNSESYRDLIGFFEQLKKGDVSGYKNNHRVDMLREGFGLCKERVQAVLQSNFL